MENTWVVRINGVEIVCSTLEQLDTVVARYGERPAQNGGATARNGKDGKPAVVDGVRTDGDNDKTLLKAFVDGGESGVLAGTLASLLGGVRGRAVQPAVEQWALRVGLDAAACVPSERKNGMRRWKLTQGAMGAARLKLGVAAA